MKILNIITPPNNSNVLHEDVLNDTTSNRRPSKKYLTGGFTLIELMVSISIFSVVMIIVIGALISLNDANKKAQALRAVVDNLNFAIEDMTRNIKTGSEYSCGVDIGAGGVVDFSGVLPCAGSSGTSATGLIVKGSSMKSAFSSARFVTCYAYYFDNSDLNNKKLKYASWPMNDTPGACNGAPTNDAYFSNFIAPEVKMSDVSFTVVNTDPTLAYKQQPIVIINLSGEIDTNRAKLKTPFAIQTTVSQRGNTQ